VEGAKPKTIKPRNFPSLEKEDTQWALKPRIFVEALDAPTKAGGQIVFSDYEVKLGGVAIPADSRGAIAVGAMNTHKQPLATSALGAGAGVDLLVKPDILAYDAVPNLPGNKAGGTPIAASFAGGMAASMLSAGAQQSWFLQALRIAPGSYFEIPDFWFKR
jgi:hypothetical protein